MPRNSAVWSCAISTPLCFVTDCDGQSGVPPSSRTRRALTRALKWLGLGIAGFVMLSILAVGLLRWIDPPTSAFMLRHQLAGRLGSEAAAPLYHEWVDLSAMPPSLALAVVAAEDQRFVQHRGFDLVEMRNAWRRYQDGGRLRGASTISQQTAKNLFLWSGRDWPRKGLEAWFTLLIEGLWSKQRVLEVYLNIAQFSVDTFGVGAASWRYFDRPAIALEPNQAALLAAVLPNPRSYHLDAPTARLQQRARWIRRQMRQLGGVAYLEELGIR
jgi:monofunctional biosynthetic peptidoglycan transglycosylase